MLTEFDHFVHSYESRLDEGLAISGESMHFFARSRVAWLWGQLRKHGRPPETILDFGCGKGDTSTLLLHQFGARSVVGVDISTSSLAIAEQLHATTEVCFRHRDDSLPTEEFDLAYCNGVFHHIPPEVRARETAWIFERLRPGGYFAFWENNPWNPGTRWVMSRIAFDRDAVLVWPRQARRLLRSQGFHIVATDFCFIFPRLLAWLRPTEPLACKVPVGAQYLVLAKKPA